MPPLLDTKPSVLPGGFDRASGLTHPIDGLGVLLTAGRRRCGTQSCRGIEFLHALPLFLSRPGWEEVGGEHGHHSRYCLPLKFPHRTRFRCIVGGLCVKLNNHSAAEPHYALSRVFGSLNGLG